MTTSLAMAAPLCVLSNTDAIASAGRSQLVEAGKDTPFALNLASFVNTYTARGWSLSQKVSTRPDTWRKKHTHREFIISIASSTPSTGSTGKIGPKISLQQDKVQTL